jgi:hypothetical protein
MQSGDSKNPPTVTAADGTQSKYLPKVYTMKPIFYRGYRCQRNIITGQFYGVPELDDTMARKITGLDMSALRIEIDHATADRQPDPWQLPRQRREVAQAA